MQHEGKGPIPLDAVRNMLLPMVKHIQALHPGKTLSIEIDKHNDCLLIKMKNADQTRSIGFAVTRAQIVARSYIPEFQPNVLGLLNALALPQDVFDQMYPPEQTLEAAVDRSRPSTDAGEGKGEPGPVVEEAPPGWDNFVR